MLLDLHKDMTVQYWRFYLETEVCTSLEGQKWWTLCCAHCDKNCKSVLTRFFFACGWSTSRFMLSIVCKWKNNQDVFTEYFLHLWYNYMTFYGKMCSYWGQRRWSRSWNSPGILLKKNPVFIKPDNSLPKLKYRTQWCVCVLTARGLDMRSNDCRTRLAMELVTPQAWAPAGLALICLLSGAYRSE